MRSWGFFGRHIPAGVILDSVRQDSAFGNPLWRAVGGISWQEFKKEKKAIALTSSPIKKVDVGIFSSIFRRMNTIPEVMMIMVDGFTFGV